MPKYPRYLPALLRPPGAGAFYDFAAQVTRHRASKLESCSLTRRFGKRVPAGSKAPGLDAMSSGLEQQES